MKKVLFFFLAIWILLSFCTILQAQNRTITPTVGGAFWHIGANWNSGQIADELAENVSFDKSNLGLVIVADGYNYTVGNVDMLGGNTLNINSTGTLNIGSTGNPRSLSTDNNTVINIYGTLIIWGNLAVRNNLVLNVFGTLIIKGDMDVKNGGNIDIQGDVQIDGDLIGGIDTDISVDGDLSVGGVIVVGNNSDLTGTGTVSTGGGCTGPPTFCQSGPLPIDLTSFEPQAIDNAVLITWSTASELNNDYFTLEKSKNGKDFVKFAQVAGSGTTSVGADYSYTDNNPSLGLSYYRLSQTDYDGTTEVFDAVSVVFTGKSNGMSVSPNPMRDQSLTIRSAGWTKSEAVVLNVYNLTGLLVAKKSFTADRYGNIEESFMLDRKLEKGLYLFELAGASRTAQIKVVGE